jgi:hypothetical protein
MKVAKQGVANHSTVGVIVGGELKNTLKTKGPDLEPPYFFKVHSTFVHNFNSENIKKLQRHKRNDFLRIGVPINFRIRQIIYWPSSSHFMFNPVSSFP